MLFLNTLRKNIFWKKYLQRLLELQKSKKCEMWYFATAKEVPDVSPSQNVKFRIPLTFTAAKVVVNILSGKYYFAKYLEITLADAKFWTPCCVTSRVFFLFLSQDYVRFGAEGVSYFGWLRLTWGWARPLTCPWRRWTTEGCDYLTWL